MARRVDGQPLVSSNLVRRSFEKLKLRAQPSDFFILLRHESLLLMAVRRLTPSDFVAAIVEAVAAPLSANARGAALVGRLVDRALVVARGRPWRLCHAGNRPKYHVMASASVGATNLEPWVSFF